MQTPIDDVRMDQLAELARQTVASVETLRAEWGQLRGRVDTLEQHLGETHAIQRRTAEHLERVSAAVDRLQRVDALAAQVDAIRERHIATDGRLENLASELVRLNHLEARMSQIRDEVAQQLAERERVGRGEILAQTQQRVEDGKQVARELQALAGRIQSIEKLPGRIEVVDRGQHELAQQIQAVAVRVEASQASFGRLEETVRRGEHAVANAVEQQAAAVDDLRAEIAAWRERLEQQSEAVRGARQVVDVMRAEAASINQMMHAAAEAGRLTEGRVDATLSAMREEIEARWERLMRERQATWDAFKRDIDAREQAVRDEIDRLRADLAGQADDDRSAAEAGFEALGKDLTELQRVLAAVSRQWRDVAHAGAEALAVELPSTSPSVVSAERRQALRRALRARRGGPGSGG